MPAFTLDGTDFQSGYVNVEKYNNEKLRIRTYGRNQWGDYTIIGYYLPLDTSVLDIVLEVNETNIESSVKVVYANNDIEANEAFSVFYSQSVNIPSDSIKLIQQNKISVIRGNESSEDLILSGITLLKSENVNIERTYELSLNNTHLVISASNVLEEGSTYNYQVEEITEVSTEITTNLSTDKSNTFTVPYLETTQFDINSLLLDNNNYYHDGEIIHSANSANETSTYPHQRKNIYLIIPTNMNTSIKNFSLRKAIVTENNIARVDVNNYGIIIEGSYVNSNTGYALSIADNETLITENFNFYPLFNGAANNDGKFRYIFINETLYDNEVSNENSITFEYTMETTEGLIETGTIILPVH